MSLQLMRFPYKVKSVRLVEGSVHKMDLIYSNPNLPASSEEHHIELCEKEADNYGVEMEITVYHTAYNGFIYSVNNYVLVQFGYEDTPYIDRSNQLMNYHYSLIEYQELLPL